MEQTARSNTQWKFRCRKRKGSLPDMKGIGASGYEYRIDFGPGYRIHSWQGRGPVGDITCGWCQRAPDADITAAKANWRDYKRRKRQEVHDGSQDIWCQSKNHITGSDLRKPLNKSYIQFELARVTGLYAAFRCPQYCFKRWLSGTCGLICFRPGSPRNSKMSIPLDADRISHLPNHNNGVSH